MGAKMTVTIETAEYARDLADVIEEGLQGDGTHIGITDSELIVKALRFLTATANLLVGPALISLEKSA
jgi:hypothetical protein